MSSTIIVDTNLWDPLTARAVLLLVTGDKPLLEDPGMRGRMIVPRAYVAGRR